jgi:GTP-binding protein
VSSVASATQASYDGPVPALPPTRSSWTLGWNPGSPPDRRESPKIARERTCADPPEGSWSAPVPVRNDIRNVAIIAHVDHGKTTLVDALLGEAGAFRRGEVSRERAMDSGDIERERGITITSKPTALTWKDHRINVVDTPGHADFGGEVERVLNMVDAVVLVVDAFEGPMPQTRFVTEKAVALGLKILVVVNKIDRDGCEPDLAVDGIFDLLTALEASDDQLDFPVVFCSARERYAMADPTDDPGPISLVLDTIIEHAPPPEVDTEAPLSMWVSTLDHDEYLGFLAIGRVATGSIKVGQRLALIRPERDVDPDPVKHCAEVFRIQKLLSFQGLRRFEIDETTAGDIVAVAGMSTLEVGDTLTGEALDTRRTFPKLHVDPPTMFVRFRVNDGPFAGKDGKWVTSRKIAERLQRETRANVALRVSNTEVAEEFEVAGRGELHLSVLMETMRREGYEFCVSRPRVVTRTNEDGTREEPYEDLSVQCDEPYAGAVIDELGRRMGEMTEMEASAGGRVRMRFRIPARGLLGYRSRFLTDTRGTGIMASTFASYGPWLGPRKTRQNGVLIVQDPGETYTYSLARLQDRGILFLGPQEPVYAGQLLGENARTQDMTVNPCINKKHSNVRSAGADEKLFLTPARQMSLEEALAFIEDDELIEITPNHMRLRKRYLDHNLRKRMDKAAAAVG